MFKLYEILKDIGQMEPTLESNRFSIRIQIGNKGDWLGATQLESLISFKFQFN